MSSLGPRAGYPLVVLVGDLLVDRLDCGFLLFGVVTGVDEAGPLLVGRHADSFFRWSVDSGGCRWGRLFRLRGHGGVRETRFLGREGIAYQGAREAMRTASATDQFSAGDGEYGDAGGAESVIG